MGLFSELGRRVEEFKQTAESAASENEPVRCPECDEQFDGAREECPECGSQLVESTRPKE